MLTPRWWMRSRPGWRNGRDGILHRVRTGVPWRDLPERFGPWKTIYERHRLWSADGTWEPLLQHVQAMAGAVGEIDWDVSVDSAVVRARQRAAGARTEPPVRRAGPKGDEETEHQIERPWRSLVGRLAVVATEVRAWAARVAAFERRGPARPDRAVLVQRQPVRHLPPRPGAGRRRVPPPNDGGAAFLSIGSRPPE